MIIDYDQQFFSQLVSAFFFIRVFIKKKKIEIRTYSPCKTNKGFFIFLKWAACVTIFCSFKLDKGLKRKLELCKVLKCKIAFITSPRSGITLPIFRRRDDMVPSTLSPLINPSFHRRNPSRPILSSPPPPRSPARRFRCAAKPSGRSWDSNAEFFRTRRFEVRDDPGWGFWKRGRRRWWSDEAEFDDDVDDDDDDDDDEIDQPWERIWIFKVLPWFLCDFFYPVFECLELVFKI